MPEEEWGFLKKGEAPKSGKRYVKMLLKLLKAKVAQTYKKHSPSRAEKSRFLEVRNLDEETSDSQASYDRPYRDTVARRQVPRKRREPNHSGEEEAGASLRQSNEAGKEVRQQRRPKVALAV